MVTEIPLNKVQFARIISTRTSKILDSTGTVQQQQQQQHKDYKLRTNCASSKASRGIR